MEHRFTVSVDGKSQGGSFETETKAVAAAAVLRERLRVKGSPGEVSVELKAQAPNAPGPQISEAEIRNAFEDLRAERDDALRRALAAESLLSEATRPAAKSGKVS